MQCILYFDGQCGLCNHFVDFVLTRDRERKLRFAPLQGVTAAEKLPASLRQAPYTTVVVAIDSLTLTHSDAALAVLRQLGPGWRALARGLACIPRGLRDWVYRFIASRRAQWFGVRETCRVPTAVERTQFLA